MFGWNKKEKGDKTELEQQNSNEVEQKKDEPTQDEQLTVAKVDSDFEIARSSKESSCEDNGYSIEDTWEDDYNVYKGGGLQWYTNITNKAKRRRNNRPNSEDNFVFSALTTQHASITTETPEVCVYGIEGNDEEIAKKLTDMSRYNDKKNKFSQVWKKLVFDFISSGPSICKVSWDNDWIGGRGPERWVGDVRVQRVNKWDFYPDPAITSLEENLQDCSYIICRYRKKLSYIKDRWNKTGNMVGEQTNDDEQIDEGSDPNQAYVVEYWHRGFPWIMPKDKAQALREKGVELEQEGETFRAKDYLDSANGDLQGIHVAYVSDGVLLEYCPYEFEHGQYPFAFTSKYFDDKSQWGFGEIRNVKIPQINHNKADELELEGMSREGLGGKIYQKGAINTKQKDYMLKNSGKGGMLFEVNNLNMIKDREGVRVPPSITNYKEHKQSMVERISGNTDIMQGQSPGSNVPFASIQELGARADSRTKGGVEKLEDFLKDINKLRIELFAQFYTEDRYYRIKGTDGKTTIEGTLKASDMQREWQREDNEVEKFIPEFDVGVTILSEKPTDRNYYTQLGKYLYETQIIDVRDFLTTLEDGKLPPTQDLIDRYEERQPLLQMMSQIQELPEEVRQQVMQSMIQGAQQVIQQIAQPQEMQQEPQMMKQPQPMEPPIQPY